MESDLIYEQFKTIFFGLKITSGFPDLYAKMNRNLISEGLPKLAKFLILLLHLKIVQHLCMSVSLYLKGCAELVWEVGLFFFTILAAISLNRLVFKRNELLVILRQLKYEPFLVPANKRSFAVATLFPAIVILFVVFRLAIEMIKIYQVSSTPDLLYRLYWFAYTIPINYNALLIITAIDVTVYCIIVAGNCICSVLLFLSFCSTVELKFRTLTAQIEIYMEKDKPPGFQQIQLWNQQYLDLCCIIEKINKVFSPLLFMWIVMYMTFIAVCITRFFNSIDNPNESPDFVLVENLILLSNVCYLFLVVLSICMHSSVIVEESKKPLFLLPLLRWKIDEDFHAKYHQIVLYSTLLSQPFTYLTAWNYFRINRATFFRAFSVLSTFLVAAIQLNPKAMKHVSSMHVHTGQ